MIRLSSLIALLAARATYDTDGYVTFRLRSARARIVLQKEREGVTWSGARREDSFVLRGGRAGDHPRDWRDTLSCRTPLVTAMNARRGWMEHHQRGRGGQGEMRPGT